MDNYWQTEDGGNATALNEKEVRTVLANIFEDVDLAMEELNAQGIIKLRWTEIVTAASYAERLAARVTRVEVLGEAPDWVKPDHIVFNAPRPLRCSPPYEENQPYGDFIHGVLYAQVNPQHEDAVEAVKFNAEMDGWIVNWITVEAHTARVKKWVLEVYMPEVAEKYGEGKIDPYEHDLGIWDQTYRNHADASRVYGDYLVGEL